MLISYIKKTFFLFITCLVASSCVTNHHKNKALNLDETGIISSNIMTNHYGSFLAGLHAREIGDTSSAADFYKIAQQKDPKNEILLNNCYNLLSIEGRFDEAYECAKTYIKTDSSSSIALMVIAIKKAKDNDFKSAIKTLNNAIISKQTRFFIHLIRSWLYVGDNQNQKALKELSYIKKNVNYLSLYHLNKAAIEDILRNTSTAKKHYEAYLVSPNTNILRALQIVGNFYLRHNMQDKALNLSNEFLAIDPNSSIIKSISKRFSLNQTRNIQISTAIDGLAETMFSMASSMNNKKSETNDLAILFARASLYLKKDLHGSNLLIASLLERKNKLKQAIKAYDKIPKTSDLYIESLLKKSLIYGNNGNIAKAIKTLKNAEKIDKNTYSIYSDMGDIYRIAEDYKNAAKSYSKAIDKIGELSSRHWVLLYARAISYEQIGKWELAEKDFLKALEINPDEPLVLNYLGYSWLDKEINIKKALKMVETAYEKRPEDGYIADSLGWAYFLTKNYKKALIYLEEGARLEAGNSVIYDHLGDLYWHLNRKNEAYFSWQKALSLDTDLKEDDIKYIKQKIKNGYFKKKDK